MYYTASSLMITHAHEHSLLVRVRIIATRLVSGVGKNNCLGLAAGQKPSASRFWPVGRMLDNPALHVCNIFMYIDTLT